MRGRSLAVLALVLALAGAGWWAWRSGVFAGPAAPTEVSQEAATLAEEKLRSLRDEGEPVQLSAVELSSLLRYRSPQWVLSVVAEPGVAITGDTLHFTGKVATDQLPSHPQLDAARGFLPDSSTVDVAGHLRPLAGGRVALEVVQVELAGLPIPARFFPRILERIGRRAEPGLAESAVALSLPEGVGSARVERGFLLLTP